MTIYYTCLLEKLPSNGKGKEKKGLSACYLLQEQYIRLDKVVIPF